jgi:hypothetical protein
MLKKCWHNRIKCICGEMKIIPSILGSTTQSVFYTCRKCGTDVRIKGFATNRQKAYWY